MNQRNRFEEKYILLICDMVCILISYYIALCLRYEIPAYRKSDTYTILLLGIMVFNLGYAIVVSPGRHFVTRGYLKELVELIKFSVSTAALMGTVIFLLRESENFSRLVFGYFLLINFLLAYIVRCAVKRIMRKHFNSDRILLKIMVITDQIHARTVIERLKENSTYHYDITGVVVWNQTDDNSEINGIPVVANQANLIEVAKLMTVDEVFIYLPEEKDPILEKMIMDFETMGVICHRSLTMVESDVTISRVEKFGGFLVASYQSGEQNYKKLAVKRIIDLIGGFVGFLIFLIMFPFIGIAIKIESKGPVLFSQARICKNGRRFKIYKFRSMYQDAEKRKKELADQNEMNGLMFKMENDPRVTKVGKFLRKTSLDEFPQFINVLRGDMSLVGTRPPTVEEFEKYTPYYRRRLCMTPGLTGIWQVSGRSDILDFDEVVKMDLQYIDNWNLLLDFKILLQTVGVVLFRKGAK